MLNVYNTAYNLKERDDKFNLKVLMNTSIYLDNLVSKHNDYGNKELFSDLFDRQYSFRYMVNDEGIYLPYEAAIRNLEINRSNKKEADLSRIRYELMHDIDKNLKNKLIVLNDKLGEDVKIVGKKVLFQKYDDKLDLMSLVKEHQLKNYYLYDITFIKGEDGIEIRLIFVVNNETLCLDLNTDIFLKNVKKYYSLLGYGINKTDFERILKESNGVLKAFHYERDYYKNINDARDNFIFNIKKYFGKFLLRSGEFLMVKNNDDIIDIPLNLVFNGLNNVSIANFLSNYTNKVITVNDVVNYLKPIENKDE